MLLSNLSIAQYSHFVILPHFINGHEFNMVSGLQSQVHYGY